jgi:ABC-type transport system substrate-binding protein
MEINAIAPTLLGERVQTGVYQIQTDWYPWGNLDPALLFITRTYAPDLTLEKFVDAAYTQAVLAAQAEVEPAARLAAYKKLNDYMIDQAFVLPIGSRPYIHAVRPEVAGFSMDPLGMVDAATVSVGN